MPPPAKRAARAPAPPPEADIAPAAHVLRQFRMVFNAVRRHFREVEKSAGLGGAQVWALSVIARRPGIGMTELAQAMDIHQSTASNLVRGLLARDLVRTEQNAKDRRAVKLRVRPGARAVLRRVPGPFEGVLPRALGELDPATLGRLEQDLDALIRRLGVDEDAGQTPLAQL